ncbi:MAG: FAD-dependent oxidoreductase [Actinomycetales bacterium]
MRIDELPCHDTEVLVVGAGPTGLMAGLVLSHRDVPAIVLDTKSGPTRESRALAVQARSMEIYDQLGLAEEIAARANPARGVQIGGRSAGVDVRGAQRGATRFPGLAIFEQSHNEELLVRTLRQRDADLRFGHRVIEIQMPDAPPGADPTHLAAVEPGPVIALVDGPDGLYRIRARWCIGADGAGSPVRHQLDVPFEGVTDEARFWVADLRGATGVPDHEVSLHFGHVSFGISFPIGPNGHVRLISLASGESIRQDEALAVAGSDLGITARSVEWFSTYQVHHRVARHFRIGPVFLAGDAAHVHSPVGGQGMNTGLQDAHNLANLLGDIHAGIRDAAAVDLYERERRPVAEHLINATDRLFGIVGRPGRMAAGLRRRFGRVAGLLVPRIVGSGAGHRAAGLIGQYRIRYPVTTGSGVPEWADDPVVGRRLPPVGENQAALRTFSWQLHSYGAVPQARPGDPSPPPDGKGTLPAWLERPVRHEPTPSGPFSAERLYLVRPDGFVVAAPALRDGEIRAQD